MLGIMRTIPGCVQFLGGANDKVKVLGMKTKHIPPTFMLAP